MATCTRKSKGVSEREGARKRAKERGRVRGRGRGRGQRRGGEGEGSKRMKNNHTIGILSFRTSGCEGSFENSPMKVTKQVCVLPIPSHSYKFQDRLRAANRN